MIFKIEHITLYQYSDKVFVEPHFLYFSPSYRSFQTIDKFELNVSPYPTGKSNGIDIEGNGYSQIWFDELLDGFSIKASMEVTSQDYNPFDFLPQPIPSWGESYAQYLTYIAIRGDIKIWSQQARADDTINYLINLNQLVNQRVTHETRYEENILTIEECFDRKQGSCRDLSYLMIQLLRSENIPARFVSGYAFNPELSAGNELHAWVEAFIPGGGWIGADPSAGVLTTNNYVPVCASLDPKKTLPVQGNYRGNATSNLSTEVIIKEITQ